MPVLLFGLMITLLALTFAIDFILEPCLYSILFFSVIAINKYMAEIVTIEERAENNSNNDNPLFHIYSIVPTETQRTYPAIDDNNISTHFYTESKAAYKIGGSFCW